MRRVFGPYRLLEPLGEGGMGVVWRAEHVETGQPAAVKTVSIPDETMLQSIRREIRALARIRHPGIVRILDGGIEDGLPWIAMELLEGVALHLHWAELTGSWLGRLTTGLEPAGRGALHETMTIRAPDAPPPLEMPTVAGVLAERARREDPAEAAQAAEPAERLPAAGGHLEQALQLVLRLCAPLAYLHGEGLVHRDLKPQNVLIRKDGQPVLVDFGLISQFGGELSRDVLELGGLMAGTIYYMAPEQIRGDLCDARADLYALGCLLFELVTGRRVFGSREHREVLLQHLEAPPRRPSELVEGVPEPLDELILRLLRKEPRGRLGYASDVASALRRIGAVDGPEPQELPRPKSYLYRPDFGGRQEEMQRLRGLLTRLRFGSGGIVLLGGQSGIGKTRLAMEVAREAAARKFQVFMGESLPPTQEGGGGGLGPLRRPLQEIGDHCRQRGATETDRVLGRRGKLLCLYDPGLAALPGQEAYPEPAVLPAQAAQLRLYGYLAETLRAVASAPAPAGPEPVPTLLVLDDLQWAGSLTLGWLAFLLRGDYLQKTPLLVIGTYRTEEVGARHASPLRDLLDEPQVLQVALGRLEKAAVGELVAGMLALASAPRLFSHYLARQSEGNPFHSDQGRMEEALACYEQALAGHREFGNRRAEAQTLGNIAVLHYDLRQMEQAQALFGQALVLSREIGDRRIESIALHNLGELRLAFGQPAEAWRLYEQALELHREIGNLTFEARTLWEMARLERLCGQAPQSLAEAERLASEAETLLRRSGFSLLLGLALCERGHVALAQGRSAAPFLAEVRENAQRFESGAGSELGRALAKLGRAEEATRQLRPGRVFRGEIFEDIHEPLRRWLTRTE